VEKQFKKEDKYLCAYFVTDKSNPKKELSAVELKNYLLQVIPGHMVPNYFVQLDKIPLTPNGKVSREELPPPKRAQAQRSTTFIAPQTGAEKIIAGTWKEVLQMDKIGINDNFFDLGGNSLNIIEVNTKLQDNMGKDIPIVTLFTYSTIRSLALHLDQNEKSGDSPKQENSQKELINEGKSMMKQVFQKMGGVPRQKKT
jgi:polyketide synthase PksN